MEFSAGIKEEDLPTFLFKRVKRASSCVCREASPTTTGSDVLYLLSKRKISVVTRTTVLILPFRDDALTLCGEFPPLVTYFIRVTKKYPPAPLFEPFSTHFY